VKAKITFVARTGGGGKPRKWVQVPFKNKKYQPVPGATAYYARGTFDGKQGRKPCGSDFETAVVFFLNLQRPYVLKAAGVEVPEALAKAAEPEPEKDEPAQNMVAQIDAWMMFIQKNRELATYNRHRNGMDDWKNFCANPPADCPAFTWPNLNKEVLLAYLRYLKTRKKKNDKKAVLAKSSVHTAFVSAATFWKHCNIRPLTFQPPFKKEDWPKLDEPNPEAYEPEEFLALCNASNPSDALMWDCFQANGMRKSEMAHAIYSDLDFKKGFWHVKRKPQFSWKPKRDKERVFPVPFWLLDKLKTRMVNAGRTGKNLIFPKRRGMAFTKAEEIDKSILHRLKTAAKKAGLDCHVDVHKFRATAITVWLEGNPLANPPEPGLDVYRVMEYVGHENPDTILHYRAKLDARSKTAHQAATRLVKDLRGQASKLAVAAD